MAPSSTSLDDLQRNSGAFPLQALGDAQASELLRIASDVSLPLSAEASQGSSIQSGPPSSLRAEYGDITQGERRTALESSPRPLTPSAEPPRSRFETYYEYVERLQYFFPQLQPLLNIERYTPDRSFTHLFDVHVLDQYEDKIQASKFEVTDPAERSGRSYTSTERSYTFKVEEECFDFLNEDIPSSVRCRFILVNDISSATIEVLGRALDLDPEMFTEHIYGSRATQGRFAWKPGNKRDRTKRFKDGIPPKAKPIFPTKYTPNEHGARMDPCTWNTNSMRKTYRTIAWYRSVNRRPVTPTVIPNVLPRVLDYPDLGERAKYSWIFRADSTVGRNSHLEERITICERIIGDCRVCPCDL